MNSPKTPNSTIEQLIKELSLNQLTVAFANSKNLNIIRSSMDWKDSDNPDIKSIKSSELITNYKRDDIIFRPRAGWSPKNSLSVYWNGLRLYSQFDTDHTETHGWFSDQDIQHIPTILHLLERIKERWNLLRLLPKTAQP